MGAPTRVLIAGESWVTHSIHQKGFDAFTTTSYHEGVGPLRAALETAGSHVAYLPNHVAATDFPGTAAELAAHDVVLLSDIGANTLLLHPDTFDRSVPMPDRPAAIGEYVAAGGGLIMVGGYLTFQGIDGRARWGGTPVEAALPVMQTVNGRLRRATIRRASRGPPAGAPRRGRPRRRVAGPAGLQPGAATGGRRGRGQRGTVRFIVAGRHGQGRSAVFTSDCGPHWCPPPFMAWDGYAIMWAQLVAWVAGRLPSA